MSLLLLVLSVIIHMVHSWQYPMLAKAPPSKLKTWRDYKQKQQWLEARPFDKFALQTETILKGSVLAAIEADLKKRRVPGLYLLNTFMHFNIEKTIQQMNDKFNMQLKPNMLDFALQRTFLQLAVFDVKHVIAGGKHKLIASVTLRIASEGNVKTGKYWWPTGVLAVSGLDTIGNIILKAYRYKQTEHDSGLSIHLEKYRVDKALCFFVISEELLKTFDYKEPLVQFTTTPIHQNKYVLNTYSPIFGIKPGKYVPNLSMEIVNTNDIKSKSGQTQTQAKPLQLSTSGKVIKSESVSATANKGDLANSVYGDLYLDSFDGMTFPSDRDNDKYDAAMIFVIGISAGMIIMCCICMVLIGLSILSVGIGRNWDKLVTSKSNLDQV